MMKKPITQPGKPKPTVYVKPDTKEITTGDHKGNWYVVGPIHKE